MKENTVLYRILVKLGIKKAIDYNSVEYLRSRGVQIGENVNILNSTIDFGHGFLVSIGNNVTLTGVKVLSHDASTQIPLGVSKVGRVIIGNDVFVGQGAIILPNTHIGNRVVIGAGAVVSRDIPDNSIAIGNPIQIVGTYDDFVERHRKQMEDRPVYHTLWSEKTWEEKERMRKELEGGIGYDP